MRTTLIKRHVNDVPYGKQCCFPGCTNLGTDTVEHIVRPVCSPHNPPPGYRVNNFGGWTPERYYE